MPDEANGAERESPEHPEHPLDTYGRGVRTALRDNATAYGFSISITAAYGLVTGSRGNASAVETVSFALGAALGFILVSLAFQARFRRNRLNEDEQVLTLSGGIDLLSVVVAVAAAFGLSHVSDFAAWPLTGAGTVVAYLLVGGLDVVLASITARHTSAGRPG